MLPRSLYLRTMLAMATLLSLVAGAPRLLNAPYANQLDLALQLGCNFLLLAALATCNYYLTARWPLPGRLGWWLLVNSLLGAGLAWGLGHLHAALVPGLPQRVLLPAYYVRGQLYVLLVLLVLYSLHFFTRAQRALLENERLQREQLLARYEVLKQQVSPHFLFNSLTTLGWLIRDQPAAAERFVEEMSRVYRYVLQHGEHNQVPLADELAFTQSYVYLLRMRFGDSLRLSVDLPDGVLALPVPPLALQTLVENAVKHNVVARHRPLSIRIFLTASHLLTVENTWQPRLTPVPGSGVGLRNLASRLRFLSDAELVIRQDDAHFTVQLPLPPLSPVKPCMF
ncbi:histidine kinase [Hymenobacter sp. NST-14]|uniref:sensor histidine kinase n=1 Tax=Hymenobacter piscis TaxID=2839984 RepID=UPI001C0134DE|nr:histidine kinase [Hymenobacter piscis]MBT9395422.1 histidine kinase [Hymenobacter piscis]